MEQDGGSRPGELVGGWGGEITVARQVETSYQVLMKRAFSRFECKVSREPNLAREHRFWRNGTQLVAPKPPLSQQLFLFLFLFCFSASLDCYYCYIPPPFDICFMSPAFSVFQVRLVWSFLFPPLIFRHLIGSESCGQLPPTRQMHSGLGSISSCTVPFISIWFFLSSFNSAVSELFPISGDIPRLVES